MPWHTLRAVCAGLVVCYGALLATASPAGFPERMRGNGRLPFLADKPLSEDGFYMLTVAWNAGAGDGLTYNRRAPTVGFQPLSTFVFAAFAWGVQAAGGDRWMLARVVLFAGVLTFLLFAGVVSRIVRELAGRSAAARDAGAVAGIIVLLDYTLFRQFTNGLETGLYTLLVGGCILLTLIDTRSERTLARTVVFGIVAGLAGLARLDFLVMIAAFLAISWLRGLMPFSRALAVGAIAGAVVAPWLLLVHRLTGHWVPTSGLAQASTPSPAETMVRAGRMALATVQAVAPWFPVDLFRLRLQLIPAPIGVILLGLAGVTLAVVGLLLARRGLPMIGSEERRVASSWALAMAVLAVVYPTIFFSTWFYPRYATPFAALALPLVSIGVYASFDRRLTRALVAALPLAFAVSAVLTLHNGVLGNSNLLAAGYTAHEIPPTSLVGGFQSGVMGYFNPNVINLDGKVNQHALEYLQADRLTTYVDKEGIAYLVDWPGVLEKLPATYLEQEWMPCPTPTPDAWIACKIRKPSGPRTSR